MRESKRILESLPINKIEFDPQEAIDAMTDEQLCMMSLSDDAYLYQTEITSILARSTVNNNDLRKTIELYRQQLIKDIQGIWDEC